jgi:hypothetical protein
MDRPASFAFGKEGRIYLIRRSWKGGLSICRLMNSKYPYIIIKFVFEIHKMHGMLRLNAY